MSNNNTAKTSLSLTVANVPSLSFEEAMQSLEEVVKKLENGQEPLESALELFELGNALKDHCKTKLEEAKLKIDTIVKQADGTLKVGVFEE